MFNQSIFSLLIVGGDTKSRKEKAEEIYGFKVNKQENNPDFCLLTSETSIGIEEIRNLEHFLQLKPYKEKRKIVFITEAQKLTEEAQNSLLKTLEEPPVNSLIILSAPDLGLLLPTIISRCEIIELPQVPQIILSKEEESVIKEKLNILLNSSLGEKFNLIEEWGIYKDRETAISFLNELTVIGRNFMLSNEEKSKYLGLLKSISAAKNYLTANSNLRLTLDVFLGEIS